MSEETKSVPESKAEGGSANGKQRPARRRERVFATVFLLICLLLPTLAGWVGYRLAHWQMAQKGSWDSPGEVREAIRLVQMQETLAGQFDSDGIPLDGVEKCYYPDPIDFAQVAWVPRTIPTPYLTFAPRPGSIPGGHVNEQQFRYHKKVESPKPAGTCRIFLVGGSTAFGCCARSNETTVAGYLERALNADSQRYGRRFEVVTAAYAHWNSTHERITVENRLLELEPDLVIALSGYNDVGCGLVGIHVNYYRGGPDVYHVLLANAMLKQESSEGFPLEPPGEQQLVSVKQTAARLRRNAELSHTALRTVGADYCFALQPILSASRKARTPREEWMLQRANHSIEAAEFVKRYDECRSQMSGVKSPHFHFWDLTGVFDAQNELDIFIDQCHFGDRGNDLIAKRMLDLVAPILTARYNPDGR